MELRARQIGVGILVAVGLALGGGCDGDGESPAEEHSGDQGAAESLESGEEGLEEAGDFFDAERLMQGAEDIGGEDERVSCVGAREEEAENLFHPRMIRGVVLAPSGQWAMNSKTWWDWVVPTAHAAPLEGELPVADVVIRLMRVDAIGEPVGEAILSTEATVWGEFCFRLPDELEYGPTLMLIAEGGERRLRRPVLHQNDVDIYSQPEALVRLLVEEGFELTSLDVDTYLNLDVMAQTAVDLLNPVELRSEAGLESLLARLDRTMREDERLMRALERLEE